MAKLNKDGLEAGSIVDFETLKRVQREQLAKAKVDKDGTAKRRNRKKNTAEGE